MGMKLYYQPNELYFLHLLWDCWHFEWLTRTGRVGAMTQCVEPCRKSGWHSWQRTCLNQQENYYSSKTEKYSITKCQLIIITLLCLSSLLLGKAIPNNIQTLQTTLSMLTLVQKSTRKQTRVCGHKGWA